MQNNKYNLLRSFAALALISSMCLRTATVLAVNSRDNSLMTVQVQQLATTLSVYAQIVPLSVIKLRALTRGNLSQLEVVPGMRVSANQVLAQLTGPLIQSLITTRQENLQTARAKAHSARQVLDITRHKYASQLITQQRLDTAISDLAAANANVQIAMAHLHEVQHMQTLRAPVDATVLSVNGSNGEQTMADQIVMTLLPANKLYLRAEIYAADTSELHIGMSGQFKPADNSKPIPVKLIAIAPNLSPDSGRVMEFTPEPDINSSRWTSGTWGKLILSGQIKPVISVPSSALILDRGKWWVLLHTPHGDIPHAVTPGLAHGWSTTIRSGLKPGQQIVVKNAFLRYHHGIAQSYMPPD